MQLLQYMMECLKPFVLLAEVSLILLVMWLHINTEIKQVKLPRIVWMLLEILGL